MDLITGENGVVSIQSHCEPKSRITNYLPKLSLSEMQKLSVKYKDFYMLITENNLVFIQPNADWSKPSQLLYTVEYQSGELAYKSKNFLQEKINPPSNHKVLH